MPATLNTYLAQTMRFLREAKQENIGALDMISYVNRARRETAMRAQCIRRLTPISGQVIGVSVINAGSGYTLGATLSISAPDFPNALPPNPTGQQATGLIMIQNGTIAASDIQNGGSGYFQPTASVVASAGSGGSVGLQVSPINLLTAGQEVYRFADVDLSTFPGVSGIYAVKSISILYSNWRYSLPVYAFSVYQSLIRRYPFQFSFVPEWASQFGQGADGSFYVYPIPSQAYQYELDCFCLPQDLITDGSAEAIPDPWTDAIPYFAASLCYAELQNFNAAKFYEDLFDNHLLRYSQYARPGRMVNPYGRY